MPAVFHVNECLHANEVETLAVSNVSDCVQAGEVGGVPVICTQVRWKTLNVLVVNNVCMQVR